MLGAADSDAKIAEETRGAQSKAATEAREAYVKALDDFAHKLYRMVLVGVRPPAIARSWLDEMVRLRLHLRQRGDSRKEHERGLTKYDPAIEDDEAGDGQR